MNTHRVVVLFTETDLAKVKAAAGRVPLSRWLRDLAVLEASVEPLPDEEKPGAEQPTKKNSEDAPPLTEQRSVPRGRGPIKRIEDMTYPAIRKHIPESGGTRSPGGKERCTYQPMGDKVCPRCHKVHSKV